MIRWFVAVIPLAGAILIPLAIPFTIARIGIAQGVIAALVLSTLWFVFMLKTSEMPH